MVLPLVKLGTLLLKTVSKPIASRLKKEAGLHPRFRHLIVNIAQVNHRISTNIQRRIYGLATDVAIRPLDEDKAIKAATDLLGELFVFTIWQPDELEKYLRTRRGQVQRSAASEARKEALRKQEIQAMVHRSDQLAVELGQLEQKLAQLHQLARGSGLSGISNVKHANANGD